MKELKEMLTESTVNEAIANTSDDPKDIHAFITPGVTETGIYGVIIGRPIIFDGVSAAAAIAATEVKNSVEHLITRTLGLRTGDRPEYTIVKDPAPKSKGRKKTKKIFVYFYDGKEPAYTIPLGSRGVYILKTGFNNM